jgi:HPt (histidine-containing phosphotransfer) domain-containing protein
MTSTIPHDFDHLPVFNEAVFCDRAGDPALQRLMFAAFERQADALLGELTVAATQDGPAWRAVLHKLKGACLTIAADRAAAHLAQAESESARLEIRDETLARLLGELDALRAVIRARLA